MAVINDSKKIQSKISKGKKAHGTKCGGNQLQASKSLLPAETHRACLITPAKRCKNKRSLWETQCPVYLLDTGHAGTLCLAHTKIQTPRNKTSVHHKRCCLYSLATLNRPHQLGNDGNAPQIQSPKCQPRANFASMPLEGQQSQTCCVNSLLNSYQSRRLPRGGWLAGRLLFLLWIYHMIKNHT